MTTQENDAPAREDEYHLTVVEAAGRLRVSPRTVWRYIEQGRLTPVRVPLNRRVFLREREVTEAQERVQEAMRSRYAERPVSHRE